MFLFHNKLASFYAIVGKLKVNKSILKNTIQRLLANFHCIKLSS